MPRLRFKVISCSSEDPNYPSDSLNDHGPNSKGWQSSRFCEYPQELVLEFLEKNENNDNEILFNFILDQSVESKQPVIV